MDDTKQPELDRIKTQYEDEFLTKIGAKDHEMEIDPLIKNEPIRRSSSFVCSEYHKPQIFRQKPKIVALDPWECKSQACRQLSMVPRFGPRQYFLNNQNIHTKTAHYLSFPSTKAIGLCHHPKKVDSL
ncbi:hypothetical protein ACF0H5_001100 [Mactra antiquata]